MNEKEFKIKLAGLLEELSTCFSTDFQPLKIEQVSQMVEKVFKIIVENNFTLDFQPYERAIKKIECGKIEIYRFNIIELMKAFRAEYELYELQKKPLKPEKW